MEDYYHGDAHRHSIIPIVDDPLQMDHSLIKALILFWTYECDDSPLCLTTETVLLS